MQQVGKRENLRPKDGRARRPGQSVAFSLGSLHAALARAIVGDTSDALMTRAVTSSSRKARSAGHSFESLSWDKRPGEMPSCAARSD